MFIVIGDEITQYDAPRIYFNFNDFTSKKWKILIIEVKIRCKSMVDVHGNIVLVCVVDA